jgi:predicted small secreted protein
MRKILMGLAVLFLTLTMTACGNNGAGSEEDIKSLVHSYSTEDHGETEASITSEELIVTEDGEETVTPLPEDEFFVSIAPFKETTHPCATHSLTGCQGELAEEAFNVKVTNEEGEVMMDEEMTSFENGFIDLWLPKGQTFNVEIEQNGEKAQSEISTYEGDDTCITTMQLV